MNRSKIFYIVIILIIIVAIYVFIHLRYDPINRQINKKRDPKQFRYNSFFKEGYHSKHSVPTSPFKIIENFNRLESNTKIISTSLYGNHPKYFDKLDKNIEFIDTFLPEWTLRIYLHDQVDMKVRNMLIGKGVEIYIVEDDAVEPGKSAGAFWRYLPLCEDVDVFVVDIDDYITKEYVNNIETFFNKSKHSLKVSWKTPWPKEYILGKQIYKKRNLVLPFDKKFIQNYPYRYEYGEDEVFLSNYIGKQIKDIEYDNNYWFFSKFVQENVM